MTKAQRTYLYVVVFISGMSTLAIELSASRLLGNVFGASNLVWAAIIGLILIYLTAGYFIGGPWADRSPSLLTMYRILLWGAFTTGLTPLVAHPVLRLAAEAFDQLTLGILFGSFAAVLILFSAPVTLLGMISPFAIRLSLEDKEKAGRIAGKIYALSTLGSFIGTFLPVLVLIPTIGTLRTFLFFAFLLMAAGLFGMWQVARLRGVLPWLWMPILLALLAGWRVAQPIKASAGQIYEAESAYNYIQVLEVDGYRYLRLNEGQGIHSVWHPTELAYNGPWELFLVAPFFNPGEAQGAYTPERVESMAIVGLAAGTLARQATAAFGPIPIDGYEIDPQIIQVGRKYFGMNLPNLTAHAEDGRWGLEHSPRRYSLIAVDAYRPPYIPWHLTTREFFASVYAHLEADGAMAINVGRAPDDRRLVDGLVGTIRTVFPSVYVIDVPDTFNTLIYATPQPTTIDDLYANLLGMMASQDAHPLLLDSIKRAVVFQQPLPETSVVFTDDKAPIEWITNSLVLRFVLQGNMESIQ
ncbi:MAG: fused MFS/spermidine synthase [Anaerolineales bacterium]|nr:fused MFS/spermidine synthase [Anaerolineales bacterium]